MKNTIKSPTHLQTLTADTPKGRRRIRKTLGLPVAMPLVEGTVLQAQKTAELREREHNAPSKGKK